MYVHARVHAGAKEEILAALSDTQLKISVREEAERNQANRRVLQLVAAYFSVPVSSVRIVHGHHTPSKLLSVTLQGE